VKESAIQDFLSVDKVNDVDPKIAMDQLFKSKFAGMELKKMFEDILFRKYEASHTKQKRGKRGGVDPESLSRRHARKKNVRSP
jgi:hypothetical protein